MASAINWGEEVGTQVGPPAPKAPVKSAIDWGSVYKINPTTAKAVQQNPDQHVMNPLNPHNQIAQKPQSLFDKIASIADDVATGATTVAGKLGLQPLMDIPAAARDYIQHSDGPDIGFKDVLGAAGTVAKQTGQGLIAGPADITIGTYEEATNQNLGPVETPLGTFQSPQSTKQQLQNSGYGPFVSSLGAVANEGINFANAVVFAAGVDDIIKSTSAAAGTKIATENLKFKLTPDELRAKLANGEIDSPAGQQIAQHFIEQNHTLEVDASRPAEGIRKYIGENLLGGEGQSKLSVGGTKMGEPIAGRLAPEPFSNEATSTPALKAGAEPFSSEPGRVDNTLEPFSNKLIDQLPDRVVQVVPAQGGAPGRFFTIPIAQAHSIIDSIDGTSNGIAGKNMDGEVYHVTAKSPSQMEALGFENAGTFGAKSSSGTSFADSGMPNPEEGSIDPGQAFKDIQDTIQRFKDNSENAKAGERLRVQFTGNRDARIAQTNQLLESLKRIVPNAIDQEAISIMRDFASNPEGIRQLLDGSSPKFQEALDNFKKDNPTATAAELAAHKDQVMKDLQKIVPVLQKAMSPTESMVAVNKALDAYYTNKLAQGKAAGVLNSSIDPKDYISHILTPKKVSLANRVSGGKFGKQFTHALERHYPTQVDAILHGVMPRTMNAFTQTSIYEDRHATAVATAEFLKQLKAEGLLKFKAGEAPDNWKPVLVGRQTIYLPQNMADAIEPLLEKSQKPNSILTNLNAYQSFVKAAEVSMSVFHMKALGITALNAEGIPTAMKSVMQNMESPEFKNQELDFIRHGGTTSILGKTIEAYRLATKSSMPTRSQLLRALPGVKQVVSLSDKLTYATFDVLQREFKVIGYSTKVASWMAKNPNATPEQLYNAKTDIARGQNAFYGGLNWDALGVSKASRVIAKALFFAPDWTYSNILTGKYTFESGPAGTASRRYMLSSIIFGLVATQLLSQAISKKFSKHPFQVHFGTDKNGKEIYGNWFFVGAPGDLTKWIDNVSQYGAGVGTAKTIGNKFQSIPRALVNLFVNKNYLGQSITIPGANPIVNSARSALQFGSDTLPIPFSLTDFAQMLQDKKQDYKLWDYLSLIGGTPPRHEVPQGSHVPTTGKNKGKVVPDSSKTTSRPKKSSLDQIKTGGSIYQPKK